MSDQKIGTQAIMWYFLIVVGMIIGAFIIFGKVCVISFLEGKEWRKIGLKPIHSHIKVLADRGNIYSTQYELMATTEYKYWLYIDFCAEGIKEDTLKRYVKCMAEGLHKIFPKKSEKQYAEHIIRGWKIRSKHRRNYRLLDHEVSFLQQKTISQMPYFNKGRNQSGLYSKELMRRVKPYGTLASRTIGNIYGDIGKGGKSGLEKYYNTILSGQPGTSTRRKVYGQFINIIDINPIRGKDIVSTIDIFIQDIVDKFLLNRLKELNAESGTVIIMEVSTGEIKAISNLGKTRTEQEWTEIQNYAVSDLSEPGSTFKLVSMMLALESGVVHPEDSVDTGNGMILIAGRPLKDHNFKNGGYGKITVSKVIRYSSNIGMALLIELVYGKNPEKYVNDIYKMGITQDMKLEIPGYGIPRIYHPKDSISGHWSKATLPWMSFGYGIQISPIYILSFFNAIANNGKLIKPFFVREIREKNKVLKKYKTQIINPKICSSRTLSIIHQMLDDVVNTSDGTGKLAHSDKVRIAGKTGTVQISKGVKGYKSEIPTYQVSFCGYFPADKPLYSGIVVIRKPKNGIPSGGATCGVLFKNIAEAIYAKNVITSNINSFPKDNFHSLYPTMVNGNIGHTINVFRHLKIPYQDRSKGSQWITSQWDTLSKRIILYGKEIISSQMPNVIGMGAKDAVFLLESIGLKVILTGKGKVVKQSIPVGVKIIKGRKIVLEFK